MRSAPRVPWLALSLLAGAGVFALLAWVLDVFPLGLPPCPLKATLGIPCLTCGGTRCGLALVGGDLGEAFHWHPVLAALALVSPVGVLWDLRRAWRGDPYPELPQGRWVRIAAVLLLAGTWILQVARGI